LGNIVHPCFDGLESFLAKDMRYISLDSSNGGGSKMVSKNTERCHSLQFMSDLQRSSRKWKIAYRVVNRVAVPDSCRKNWIDELIHPLERLDVWVDPGGSRGGNLFDNKTNELVAEVLADVWWEVLDPGTDPRPIDHPRDDEGWERGFLELYLGWV
jgi:hypothetical protein